MIPIPQQLGNVHQDVVNVLAHLLSDVSHGLLAMIENSIRILLTDRPLRRRRVDNEGTRHDGGETRLKIKTKPRDQKLAG